MSEAELKELQCKVESIQKELEGALDMDDSPLFDSLPEDYHKDEAPGGKNPFMNWRKPNSNAHNMARPVRNPHVDAAIADVSWHPDSKQILVCCQDGRVEILNLEVNIKEYLITPQPDVTRFYMACAFEPTKGNMFAVGGLDNLCTIYRPYEDESLGESPVPVSVCTGHKGYVSDIGWLNESSLVTGSGDTTCKLWDVETGKAKTTFYGHLADACCLTTFQGDENIFATGSLDHSIRIWDARIKGTFTAARFYLGSKVLAIKSLGSDCIGCTTDMVGMEMDGEVKDDTNAIGEARLLDIRSKQQLQFFRPEGNLPVQFSKIEFSKSGRYVFLGSGDSWLFPFDVKTGEDYDPIFINDKSERSTEAEEGAVGIAALEMSPDGTAMCASVRGEYLTILAA